MDFRPVVLSSMWYLVLILIGVSCAPSASDEQMPAESSRSPLEQSGTYDSAKSNDDVKVGESSYDSHEDIVIPQPVTGSWLACAKLESEAQCELDEKDLEKVSDESGEIRWVARWADGQDLPEYMANQVEFDVSKDGMRVSISFGNMDEETQGKIVVEVMKGSVVAGRSQVLAELPKVILDTVDEVESEGVESSSFITEDEESLCANGSVPQKRGSWLVCQSGWASEICPEGQQVQSNQYCPTP